RAGGGSLTSRGCGRPRWSISKRPVGRSVSEYDGRRTSASVRRSSSVRNAAAVRPRDATGAGIGAGGGSGGGMDVTSLGGGGTDGSRAVPRDAVRGEAPDTSRSASSVDRVGGGI